MLSRAHADVSQEIDADGWEDDIVRAEEAKANKLSPNRRECRHPRRLWTQENTLAQPMARADSSRIPKWNGRKERMGHKERNRGG